MVLCCFPVFGPNLQTHKLSRHEVGKRAYSLLVLADLVTLHVVCC
jgi:hypothetical protein